MPVHKVENPVSDAYQIFLEGWNHQWQHSADLIAVYVAVKEHEPPFKLINLGYNHTFENGVNIWRRQPNEPRHYVVAEFAEGTDPVEVAARFDEFLIKQNLFY